MSPGQAQRKRSFQLPAPDVGRSAALLGATYCTAGSPGVGSGPVLLISLSLVANPGLAPEPTINVSWIEDLMQGLGGRGGPKASLTRMSLAHSCQAGEYFKVVTSPSPDLYPREGWRSRNT